jgi:uncharacterized protein (TIGR00369 family)
VSEADASVRRETIEWTDPRVALPSLATMSGREYLEAVRDGALPPPPIASVMHFGVISIGEGTVEFDCEPTEAHFNPLGSVHGGLACTLLDTVVGCAVHTLLPAGVGYTSIDLNVSYLRPIQPELGRIRAIGTVVKPGSRVSFAEGRIEDARGRVLATATSSLLILQGRETS